MEKLEQIEEQNYITNNNTHDLPTSNNSNINYSLTFLKNCMEIFKYNLELSKIELHQEELIANTLKQINHMIKDLKQKKFFSVNAIEEFMNNESNNNTELLLIFNEEFENFFIHYFLNRITRVIANSNCSLSSTSCSHVIKQLVKETIFLLLDLFSYISTEFNYKYRDFYNLVLEELLNPDKKLNQMIITQSKSKLSEFIEKTSNINKSNSNGDSADYVISKKSLPCLNNMIITESTFNIDYLNYIINEFKRDNNIDEEFYNYLQEGDYADVFVLLKDLRFLYEGNHSNDNKNKEKKKEIRLPDYEFSYSIAYINDIVYNNSYSKDKNTSFLSFNKKYILKSYEDYTTNQYIGKWVKARLVGFEITASGKIAIFSLTHYNSKNKNKLEESKGNVEIRISIQSNGFRILPPDTLSLNKSYSIDLSLNDKIGFLYNGFVRESTIIGKNIKNGIEWSDNVSIIAINNDNLDIFSNENNNDRNNIDDFIYIIINNKNNTNKDNKDNKITITHNNILKISVYDPRIISNTNNTYINYISEYKVNNYLDLFLSYNNFSLKSKLNNKSSKIASDNFFSTYKSIIITNPISVNDSNNFFDNEIKLNQSYQLNLSLNYLSSISFYTNLTKSFKELINNSSSSSYGNNKEYLFSFVLNYLLVTRHHYNKEFFISLTTEILSECSYLLTHLSLSKNNNSEIFNKITTLLPYTENPEKLQKEIFYEYRKNINKEIISKINSHNFEDMLYSIQYLIEEISYYFSCKNKDKKKDNSNNNTESNSNRDSNISKDSIFQLLKDCSILPQMFGLYYNTDTNTKTNINSETNNITNNSISGIDYDSNDPQFLIKNDFYNEVENTTSNLDRYYSKISLLFGLLIKLEYLNFIELTKIFNFMIKETSNSIINSSGNNNNNTKAAFIYIYDKLFLRVLKANLIFLNDLYYYEFLKIIVFEKSSLNYSNPSIREALKHTAINNTNTSNNTNSNSHNSLNNEVFDINSKFNEILFVQANSISIDCVINSVSNNNESGEDKNDLVFRSTSDSEEITFISLLFNYLNKYRSNINTNSVIMKFIYKTLYILSIKKYLNPEESNLNNNNDNNDNNDIESVLNELCSFYRKVEIRSILADCAYNVDYITTTLVNLANNLLIVKSNYDNSSDTEATVKTISMKTNIIVFCFKIIKHFYDNSVNYNPALETTVKSILISNLIGEEKNNIFEKNISIINELYDTIKLIKSSNSNINTNSNSVIITITVNLNSFIIELLSLLFDNSLYLRKDKEFVDNLLSSFDLSLCLLSIYLDLNNRDDNRTDDYVNNNEGCHGENAGLIERSNNEYVNDILSKLLNYLETYSNKFSDDFEYSNSLNYGEKKEQLQVLNELKNNKFLSFEDIDIEDSKNTRNDISNNDDDNNNNDKDNFNNKILKLLLTFYSDININSDSNNSIVFNSDNIMTIIKIYHNYISSSNTNNNRHSNNNISSNPQFQSLLEIILHSSNNNDSRKLFKYLIVNFSLSNKQETQRYEIIKKIVNYLFEVSSNRIDTKNLLRMLDVLIEVSEKQGNCGLRPHYSLLNKDTIEIIVNYKGKGLNHKNNHVFCFTVKESITFGELKDKLVFEINKNYNVSKSYADSGKVFNVKMFTLKNLLFKMYYENFPGKCLFEVLDYNDKKALKEKNNDTTNTYTNNTNVNMNLNDIENQLLNLQIDLNNNNNSISEDIAKYTLVLEAIETTPLILDNINKDYKLLPRYYLLQDRKKEILNLISSNKNNNNCHDIVLQEYTFLSNLVTNDDLIKQYINNIINNDVKEIKELSNNTSFLLYLLEGVLLFDSNNSSSNNNNHTGVERIIDLIFSKGYDNLVTNLTSILSNSNSNSNIIDICFIKITTLIVQTIHLKLLLLTNKDNTNMNTSSYLVSNKLDKVMFSSNMIKSVSSCYQDTINNYNNYDNKDIRDKVTQQYSIFNLLKNFLFKNDLFLNQLTNKGNKDNNESYNSENTSNSYNDYNVNTISLLSQILILNTLFTKAIDDKQGDIENINYNYDKNRNSLNIQEAISFFKRLFIINKEEQIIIETEMIGILESFISTLITIHDNSNKSSDSDDRSSSGNSIILILFNAVLLMLKDNDANDYLISRIIIGKIISFNITTTNDDQLENIIHAIYVNYINKLENICNDSISKSDINNDSKCNIVGSVKQVEELLLSIINIITLISFDNNGQERITKVVDLLLDYITLVKKIKTVSFDNQSNSIIELNEKEVLEINQHQVKEKKDIKQKEKEDIEKLILIFINKLIVKLSSNSSISNNNTSSVKRNKEKSLFGLINSQKFKALILEHNETSDSKDNNFSLDLYSSNEPRNSTGYCGLKNLGSTCYMNSVLQQLFHIKAFSNMLLSLSIKEEDYLEKLILNNDPSFSSQMNTNISHLSNSIAARIELQRIFGFLALSNRRDINTMRFCYAFKDGKNKPTDTSLQQDAQEFLGRLFDRVEESLKKTSHKYIVKDIFSGELCSLLVCFNCNNNNSNSNYNTTTNSTSTKYNKNNKNISNNSTNYFNNSLKTPTSFIKTKSRVKFDDFYQLSLEVMKPSNLYESLDLYTNKEIVEDYFCESCLNKSVISKQNYLVSLPNILVFHLQKINIDFMTFQNKKINKRYEFSKTINMKKYCIETEEKLVFDNLEDDNEKIYKKREEYYEYDLKGVIIHSGCADGGHYYSYINVKNNRVDKIKTTSNTDTNDNNNNINSSNELCWLEFNDSNVSFFDESKLNEEAFGGKETNNGMGNGINNIIDNGQINNNYNSNHNHIDISNLNNINSIVNHNISNNNSDDVATAATLAQASAAHGGNYNIDSTSAAATANSAAANINPEKFGKAMNDDEFIKLLESGGLDNLGFENTFKPQTQYNFKEDTNFGKSAYMLIYERRVKSKIRVVNKFFDECSYSDYLKETYTNTCSNNRNEMMKKKSSQYSNTNTNNTSNTNNRRIVITNKTNYNYYLQKNDSLSLNNYLNNANKGSNYHNFSPAFRLLDDEKKELITFYDYDDYNAYYNSSNKKKEDKQNRLNTEKNTKYNNSNNLFINKDLYEEIVYSNKEFASYNKQNMAKDNQLNTDVEENNNIDSLLSAILEKITSTVDSKSISCSVNVSSNGSHDSFNEKQEIQSSFELLMNYVLSLNGKNNYILSKITDVFNNNKYTYLHLVFLKYIISNIEKDYHHLLETNDIKKLDTSNTNSNVISEKSFLTVVFSDKKITNLLTISLLSLPSDSYLLKLDSTAKSNSNDNNHDIDTSNSSNSKLLLKIKDKVEYTRTSIKEILFKSYVMFLNKNEYYKLFSNKYKHSSYSEKEFNSIISVLLNMLNHLCSITNNSSNSDNNAINSKENSSYFIQYNYISIILNFIGIQENNKDDYIEINQLVITILMNIFSSNNQKISQSLRLYNKAYKKEFYKKNREKESSRKDNQSISFTDLEDIDLNTDELLLLGIESCYNELVKEDIQVNNNSSNSMSNTDDKLNIYVSFKDALFLYSNIKRLFPIIIIIVKQIYLKSSEDTKGSDVLILNKNQTILINNISLFISILCFDNLSISKFYISYLLSILNNKMINYYFNNIANNDNIPIPINLLSDSFSKYNTHLYYRILFSLTRDYVRIKDDYTNLRASYITGTPYYNLISNESSSNVNSNSINKLFYYDNDCISEEQSVIAPTSTILNSITKFFINKESDFNKAINPINESLIERMVIRDKENNKILEILYNLFTNYSCDVVGLKNIVDKIVNDNENEDLIFIISLLNSVSPVLLSKEEYKEYTLRGLIKRNKSENINNKDNKDNNYDKNISNTPSYYPISVYEHIKIIFNKNKTLNETSSNINLKDMIQNIKNKFNSIIENNNGVSKNTKINTTQEASITDKLSSYFNLFDILLNKLNHSKYKYSNVNTRINTIPYVINKIHTSVINVIGNENKEDNKNGVTVDYSFHFNNSSVKLDFIHSEYECLNHYYYDNNDNENDNSSSNVSSKDNNLFKSCGKISVKNNSESDLKIKIIIYSFNLNSLKNQYINKDVIISADKEKDIYDYLRNDQLLDWSIKIEVANIVEINNTSNGNNDNGNSKHAINKSKGLSINKDSGEVGILLSSKSNTNEQVNPMLFKNIFGNKDIKSNNSDINGNNSNSKGNNNSHHYSIKQISEIPIIKYGENDEDMILSRNTDNENTLSINDILATNIIDSGQLDNLLPDPGFPTFAISGSDSNQVNPANPMNQAISEHNNNNQLDGITIECTYCNNTNCFDNDVVNFICLYCNKNVFGDY